MSHSVVSLVVSRTRWRACVSDICISDRHVLLFATSFSKHGLCHVQVNSEGPACGYMLENFGDDFVIPELGPIGAFFAVNLCCQVLCCQVLRNTRENSFLC